MYVGTTFTIKSCSCRSDKSRRDGGHVPDDGPGGGRGGEDHRGSS